MGAVCLLIANQRQGATEGPFADLGMCSLKLEGQGLLVTKVVGQTAARLLSPTCAGQVVPSGAAGTSDGPSLEGSERRALSNKPGELCRRFAAAFLCEVSFLHIYFTVFGETQAFLSFPIHPKAGQSQTQHAVGGLGAGGGRLPVSVSDGLPWPGKDRGLSLLLITLSFLLSCIRSLIGCIIK